MGTPTMDDQPCRSYFPQPHFHRRYEALRAFFVEGGPTAEVAARYGYKPAAFNVMVSQFRSRVRRGDVPPFSSPTAAVGPPGGRVAEAPRARRRPGPPIGGPST